MKKLLKPLNDIIRNLIQLQQSGKARITLLAVCPNSAAVLEAAVKAATANNTLMLFAATLNQVDTDGGYTGWTPQEFVRQMYVFAEKYQCKSPLYPCLDHGGPWLKDRHTLDKLSFEETMAQVKESIAACLDAGYALLHIDPTVDRTLPPGAPIPLETVVARTLDLIAYAEAYRSRRGMPPIAYEVGTEEVHGGLVDFSRFEHFLELLRAGLNERGLAHAWPCFVVAQVGTDLHTTSFDPIAACRLYTKLTPLGSLVKGHYTDWVENPGEYPAAGMGGANVGPEFTAEEYLALKDLELKEKALFRTRTNQQPSRFLDTLQAAVLASARWKKWLQPDEKGLDFEFLPPARKEWLLQTSSRYIWTEPSVVAARQQLYTNLAVVMPAPHDYVVERVVRVIDKYINQFSLFDSLSLLD